MKTAAPIDLFIRRAYTHKGISVVVDIDLAGKTVSLVEPDGKDGYRGKKWDFTSRSLGYMAGWQAILDAMKYAIAEATKELKAEEERGNKKMADLLIAIAVNDLDHLKKKGGKNA